MNEQIKPDVSGTAFVVNYSRSKMVEISQDRYAHLWVIPEAIALWEELSQEVYPNDDLNVSLRNRFFLEQLKKFVSTQQPCVFVSIAAGFDNYPFLIEANFRSLEFDLPNIMALKKHQVELWMQDGQLPRRNIDFLAIDLNSANQRLMLKQTLKQAIEHDPSFVLMEGLTYYLRKEVLSDIFAIIRDAQTPGSLVAFDYWQPDAMGYPAMVRLKTYLDKKFGDSGKDWNLLDEAYINELSGFTAIKFTDIATLERKFAETNILQGKDNKIPAYYAVLKNCK
jgi:O-methyltransferase involved in polyketide biosynthesis